MVRYTDFGIGHRLSKLQEIVSRTEEPGMLQSRVPKIGHNLLTEQQQSNNNLNNRST